jgi:hypothetical protein
MIIIGVPLQELQDIVAAFPSLAIYREVSMHLRRDGRPQANHFRLAMKNPTQKERRKDTEEERSRKEAMNEYRKRGFSGHWTGAVCYHGYTKVMDVIFRDCPEAEIRSKFATFKGAEDYRTKRDMVGMQNVGSAYNPQRYREQCDCYGG